MKHQLTDADINCLMTMLQTNLEDTLEELRVLLPQDSTRSEAYLASSEDAEEIRQVKNTVLNIARHCREIANDGRLRREITTFIAAVERGIEIQQPIREQLEQAYKANVNQD